MKIVYNSILPAKGYTAINLFGLIFARHGAIISDRTKRHELIHTAQGKELFWLFFYVWYGAEWLFRLIQYRDKKQAYRNISFEREAYANDYDPNYLISRHRFAFIHYLKDI